MTDFAFETLDIAACYGTGSRAKAISYGTASLLAPSPVEDRAIPCGDVL